MKRREFLGACGVMAGAAGLTCPSGAGAQVETRRYPPALLVDIHGVPIQAAKLAAETNYVFQYPFAATPCFLLRLAKPSAGPATLRREGGGRYQSPGGVGPGRAVVAFSAICAHKLAYPTREVSFIRYQRDRSSTSAGSVIHCCADHSVYDPVEGARVVSGPAPQPLAAIVLEHDPATDRLAATGTVGAEQFEPFFAKYEMKLALEYGGRGRRPVEGTTVVRELAQYCRNTIQC
ncbi:MAG: (2Fe-2S)-binding protein [Burkholderiales bacterium]|nr:(2Fe-2S)-binding protein [Burkholderiales bacterium]